MASRAGSAPGHIGSALNDLIKQLQSFGPSWLEQAPLLAGRPRPVAGRAGSAPGHIGSAFNDLIKQLQSFGPSWLEQAPPLASWLGPLAQKCGGVDASCYTLGWGDILLLNCKTF